jgi:hypothetical protein
VSRALDIYRHLTDDERERFRNACVEDHVDPADRCPLCRGRRLTREHYFRYCDVHFSWEHDRPTLAAVACHNCKVQWVVTLRRACEPNLEFA